MYTNEQLNERFMRIQHEYQTMYEKHVVALSKHIDKLIEERMKEIELTLYKDILRNLSIVKNS